MKTLLTGKLCFFAILLLAFGSCTDFFSTSWAEWAARNPDDLIPPVTAGNVNDLVRQAENNTDLSFSLLKKIEEAAKGASGDDAAALQAAAAKTAANATDPAGAILKNVDALVEDSGNAQQVIANTLNDMPHLQEAGGILASVLPTPGTPEFDAFVEKASPEDLSFAAVIVLAGEAQKAGDAENYLTTTFDPATPNPAESMALALAKAALDKGATGGLENLLDGLKLL